MGRTPSSPPEDPEGIEEMADITSSRVTVRHSVTGKSGIISFGLGSGCLERRAAIVFGDGGMKVSLEVRTRRAARMSPSAHLERTRAAIFSADSRDRPDELEDGSGNKEGGAARFSCCRIAEDMVIPDVREGSFGAFKLL